MKYTTTALLLIFSALFLPFTNVRATADVTAGPKIVFSAIQATGAKASDDALAIQNIGAAAIDVTNWRIQYASASGKTLKYVDFARSDDPLVRVVLPSGASQAFSSPSYEMPGTDALPSSFSLSHTGGSLSILDDENIVIHSVAWGSAQRTYEVLPAMTVKEGISYSVDQARYIRSAPGMLTFVTGGLTEVTDVCSNIQGIQEAVPTGYTVTDALCEPEPVDVCPALEGVQIDVPTGYSIDDNGECQREIVDVCPQLEGMQVEVPEGYELKDGACHMSVVDVCSNIDGVQEVAPDGMIVQEDGVCAAPPDVCPAIPGTQSEVPMGYQLHDGVCVERAASGVLLTEVLANPAGTDTGVEYLEFYNDNTTDRALQDMYIVRDDTKYRLQQPHYLSAKEYRTIPAKQFGLTLANSSGAVMKLYSHADAELQRIPAYAAAKDDQSWSRNEAGEWRYMQKTPNAENIENADVKTDVDQGQAVIGSGSVRVNEEVDVTSQAASSPTSAKDAEERPCRDGWYRYEPTGRCRKYNIKSAEPAACPAGSYRNPSTNRCKKSSAVRTATVAPCPAGKYRNPQTNRCKAVTTVSLVRTACPSGSYRNPETNRCKKITLATAQLKPCKEGWERNPETNRCRKASATLASTDADITPYPVQGDGVRAAETTGTMLGWWIAGGAVVIATSRLAWEWRSEMHAGWSKIKQKMGGE